MPEGLGNRVLEPASRHISIPKPQFCLAGLLPQPDVTKPSGFFTTISNRNPTWSPTLCHRGIPVHPPSALQLKPEITTSTCANCWTFVHQQDMKAAGQAPRQLPTQLLLFAATMQMNSLQRCKLSLEIRMCFCASPCTPSVSKVWARILN